MLGVTPARSVPARGEVGILGGTTRGKSLLSRRMLPASSGIQMESGRSGLWWGALLHRALQASGVCLGERCLFGSPRELRYGGSCLKLASLFLLANVSSTALKMECALCCLFCLELSWQYLLFKT